MLHSRGRVVVAALLGSLIAACSTSGPGGNGGKAVAVSPAALPTFVTSMPMDEVSVSPGSGASELALGASRTLYRNAPLVVVAAESDLGSQARGASLAVGLGAPLLLSPDTQPAATAGGRELRQELRRLDPTNVLTIGSAAAEWAAANDVSGWVTAPSDTAAAEVTLGITLGRTTGVAPAGLVTAIAGLATTSPAVLTVPPAVTNVPGSATGAAQSTGADPLPETDQALPLAGLVVLTSPDPAWAAATATAVATGADVQVLTAPDPRESSEAIAAISARDGIAVVALGDTFGPPELLADRVAVAATGVELPGGQQVLFPGRRLVSLYGTPGTPSLGALGEQDVDAAITRAREVAATYESVSGEPVVPAFEIIATVASGAPGEDGDYSYEADLAQIAVWVAAARQADMYVVLDLQPGRSDFLSQAQRYEELLRQPHVGLALDPEWRLEPDQVHLRQIGSVGAQEVNTVVTWLADLVAENDLPQKLLLLHQFSPSMIENRDQVDTGREELAILVHADGYGSRDQKLESWRNLRVAGADRFWWGWKNFYDEDTPTMTPEQTMAVDPAPVFVSYQ